MPLGIGLTIAPVTGLVLRVVGQLALMPSRPLVTVAVFVLTVPVMQTLVVGIFRRHGLSSGTRWGVAVLLIVSGILVDVVLTALFLVAYPDTGLEAAGFFEGLLLLAYATVLAVGFVSR